MGKAGKMAALHPMWYFMMPAFGCKVSENTEEFQISLFTMKILFCILPSAGLNLKAAAFRGGARR